MTKRANRKSSGAAQRIPPGVTKFLLGVAVIACLALAKTVMIPVAFAVLLAFVLNPVVLLLTRRGVPRAPAVLTVVLAVGALAGTCGWLLTSQVLQFANQLPEYEQNISQRIDELRQSSRHSAL